MGNIPLRVLIVEDSSDDTTLIIRVLLKGGFDPTWERVETEDTMRSILREKPWDIILCDYKMPNFDGLHALAVLKGSGLDIPFIIVSGTIGEEVAVEAMKAGANDYVMKGNLPRLIPAIRRELRDAALREEKRKAEKALQESEMFFQKIVENIPYMIFVKEAKDLRFVRINRAGEELLGYPREELLGKTDYDFFPHEQADFFTRKDKEVIAAEKLFTLPVEEIDTRLLGKRLLHTKKIPILNANGIPQYLLGISEDVTEHKNLEAQLFQAQKMEAVGTLASGVAHDFNNLLQVVLGYSDMLLIAKKSEDPEYDSLNKIRASAKRGADLVKRLLTFSRKGETNPRPLNLNHEVTQMKYLLERTIPKMISIELRLEDEVPIINADPIQVEQILMNLAINAKDAMPEQGGTLTIETRNVTLDQKYCKLHVGSRPGPSVMLSVSDTGFGMTQETLEHIFEPFFTTKGVGKGTGLGLAMVYGIVRHHGGHITCDSVPGHGTTFRLYFPVTPVDLDKTIQGNGLSFSGGSETLLMVDDEEALLSMSSEMLIESGYTVLTANSGVEAIEIYGKRQDEIALVILDKMMPEMGGVECLREILKINPKAKAIICSGLLSDETQKQIKKIGAKGFIQKPSDIRKFLQTIREVLD